MQIPIFRGGGCVKLIDVCNPKQWKTISASELVEDGYPVFGANGIIGYFSDYNHENPTLCITCRGATCGTVNKSLPYSYITGNSMALDDLDESVITIDFLYYFLQYRGFDDVITGSAQPQITRQSLSKIFIPEIDLNIQKNITQIIKSLEQLILNRDKQRENFNMLVKSRFNEMFGDIFDNPQSKLEDHIELNPNKKELQNFNDNVSFLPMSNVSENGKIDLSINRNIDDVRKGFTFFKDNDVIVAKITPCFENGKGAPVFGLLNGVGFGSTEFHVLRPKNTVNTVWLYHVTMLSKFRLEGERKMTGSGGQRRITKDFINNFKLNIPPLSLQNEFADFVDQVDKSQFACQMAIKLWRNSLKSSII